MIWIFIYSKQRSSGLKKSCNCKEKSPGVLTRWVDYFSIPQPDHPEIFRNVNPIKINYSRLIMPLALSRGILLRPRSEPSTVLGLWLSLHLLVCEHVLLNNIPVFVTFKTKYVLRKSRLNIFKPHESLRNNTATCLVVSTSQSDSD